jgi:hypothetical protein
MAAGTYQADALALLLTPQSSPPPVLVLPGVSLQSEVDRSLGVYEAWVHVEAVREVLV